MRLLNTCTWEMKEFVSDAHIPPYAILSHTWGSTEDECSFQEWQHLPALAIKQKEGFQKIEYCCRQAAKDGLEWVWIDTCCIDKTSSAELTEAINSMFRWYRNAEICYAYLSDVSRLGRASTVHQRLERSRWFTRGWTLQELIAPAEVVFYSMDWDHIGTKSELSASISSITKIDAPFLDSKNLLSTSLAQRMSWAAHRETSRTEDIAYCLLGIFDVNMPLIYGEGMKAFQRLQEEIIKSYPYDYSLFAWGTTVSRYSREITEPESLVGDKQLEWEPSKDSDDLFGLLAESPRDFEYSGQFICFEDSENSFFFEGTKLVKPVMSHAGKTLSIYLSLEPFQRQVTHALGDIGIAQVMQMRIAILPCGKKCDDDFYFVGIPLIVASWAADTWKVDIPPEIKIRVKTERILLDNDPSRPVDIVDFVVADKTVAPHWFEESTALLEQRQERSTPDERDEVTSSSGSHAAGRRPRTRALTRALHERPAAIPGESSSHAAPSKRASGRAPKQSRRSERKRKRDRDEI
ncbi:hypothetical protein DL771_005013 [Monosporascus sp. 5C6A]|nr:hypothetical protein DL771_005013 [Monosporascus sp. 5C6A]